VSVEQKRAWFMVGMFGLAVVACLVLIPVLGLPAALGGLGLSGLGGFATLVFRDRAGQGEVATDERDRMIAEKATLGGAMASHLALIAICMTAWGVVFAYQGRETIPVHSLPWISIGASIVFYVARSVAVIVLYGPGKRHAAD